jgi:hypothetical protein
MKTYKELKEGLFSDNIIVSPPKDDVQRAKTYLDAWDSDVEWDGDSFEVDEGDWNNLSKELSYMAGDPKWDWTKHPSYWKKEAV